MEIQNSEEQHHQGDFLRIPQVRSSSSIAYLVVNCVIPGIILIIFLLNNRTWYCNC